MLLEAGADSGLEGDDDCCAPWGVLLMGHGGHGGEARCLACCGAHQMGALSSRHIPAFTSL